MMDLGMQEGISITRSRSYCQCSGHCNAPGHRSRTSRGERPCTSRTLVYNTKLCVDCKCSLTTCTRPRYVSDLCHGHRKQLQGLPWCSQAIRAARVVLPTMAPCDVTAFMEEFVSLREGLTKVLLCAWSKEPTAVRAFARESNGLCATAVPTAVFRSFQSTVRIVAEAWPDNKAELQQLSRQGVARFMGVRAACHRLQVIAPRQRISASASPRGLSRGSR